MLGKLVRRHLHGFEEHEGEKVEHVLVTYGI